ncbi:MAG TPA: integron integrase [Candidatus Binatia bacterium]|nr:integron integrase [Candidatus Binatia bacterium]
MRPRFVPVRSSLGNTHAPPPPASLQGRIRTASLPAAQKPKLLDQVRAAIRLRHYSLRTEEAYVHWIRRFIFFHGKRHPLEMGEQEISHFLSVLAVEGRVSASTQNQALCALLFLYRHVLDQQVGWLDEVVRARRPQRLPVVLSRQEVRALLGGLDGVHWLMASLLYGAGLHLLECLRLRVKDLDFAKHQLVVRAGKGDKDRVTVLPVAVAEPLTAHLARVHSLHQQDLAQGLGRVFLPDALHHKYPQADKEWGWQWVFPASQLSIDPRSGTQRRQYRGQCPHLPSPGSL